MLQGTAPCLVCSCPSQHLGLCPPGSAWPGVKPLASFPPGTPSPLSELVCRTLPYPTPGTPSWVLTLTDTSEEFVIFILLAHDAPQPSVVQLLPQLVPASLLKGFMSFFHLKVWFNRSWCIWSCTGRVFSVLRDSSATDPSAPPDCWGCSDLSQRVGFPVPSNTSCPAVAKPGGSGAGRDWCLILWAWLTQRKTGLCWTPVGQGM